MKVLITIYLFVLSSVVQAQISLSSPFTDHMVLQQKSKVAIWGKGNPLETIKIVGSWRGKDTVKVKVDIKGHWMSEIKTTQAGGPYTLHVLGSSSVKLKDIMLGEVWLCSGQSNMEWCHLQPVFNQEQEIAAANHPNLRILHIPRGGSKQLQDSCHGVWEECTPESMKKSSAVGYYFGRELMLKMNVPIGIISNSYGGSPAEAWVPKQVVENNPILNKNVVTNAVHWPEPGFLYNKMIHPIIPYTLAGTIWYQGESNVGSEKSLSYGLLMEKLIESWRGLFNNKKMPFYLVQIAPFEYGGISDLLAVATLREQQELVASEVPYTGMVVVSDLVDNIKDIHPQNKLDVGIRLANMAMADNYKMAIKSYCSPTYRDVKFKGDKAYVSFYNVVTDMEIRGSNAIGFMIAGDDGKFVNATALIESGVVIVQAKEVSKPTAVRYCFDHSTIGNVFTEEGLPLAPFRTDLRTQMLKDSSEK